MSRARSAELRKANEELRKNLQQLDEFSTVELGPIAQLRARPKPFSKAIMDAITANYITPKIVFHGSRRPQEPSYDIQCLDDHFERNRRHTLEDVHGYVHMHNSAVL